MRKNKYVYGKIGNTIRTLISMLLVAVMVTADITPVFALESGDYILPEEQDGDIVLEEASESSDDDILREEEQYEMMECEDTVSESDREEVSGTASGSVQEADEYVSVSMSAESDLEIIDGLIQNGEFPSEIAYDEDRPGIVSEGAADESFERALEAVVSAARNWNGADESVELDFASYNMPVDKSSRLSSAVNLHPELFYVSNLYRYSGNGIITKIGIRFDKKFTLNDIATFKNKADTILNGVDPQWTPTQKLIYLHDYLTSHINYDQTYKKYDAYNALVEGSCVCQGYSLAYAYLVNRVNKGFDCTVVTSNYNNHAWNLVTLNGRKYYVDNTWDDPIRQYEYYNRYDNCLISKSKLISNDHKSNDWVDSYGNNVYNTVTGNEYDNPVWGEMHSTMPMFGTTGAYYSGYGKMTIYKYDFTNGDVGSFKEYNDALWKVWGNSGYWTRNFSHIAAVGSNLLVTLPDKIYVIDQSGKDITSYDNKGSGRGYIYGGQVNGNTLSYDVYTNPPSGSNSQYIGRYTQILDAPAPAVPVSSVTLNKSSLSMTTGGTATLTATVLPSNATNKTVIWGSSDANVVTVSDGALTAKKAGRATITVTSAADTSKKAQCTVTVTDPAVPVSSVTLNKSTLSMTTGGTATLTATVLPSNATNKTVTWGSSDANVVTVSDGALAAKKAGRATITVTSAADTSKKAQCMVTVTDPAVPVTGVAVSPVSLKLQLQTGKTVTGALTATVSPSNATDKSVTWSSSNTAVATVNSTGRVTARAAGTATVTVKTADGGKTAACRVTVEAAPDPQDPDDPGDKPSLTISEITETLVYDGSAKTPSPEVYYGKKKLEPGKDYSLSYKNNINASANASVTVKFSGNYEGSLTRTFTIGKADINDAKINSPIAYTKYKTKNGNREYSVQKLVPTVIFNGKTLKNNTDYTLVYTDTSDGAYAEAGNYGIKVTGKGNYIGERNIDEQLIEKEVQEIIDLKKAAATPVDSVKSYPYTGEEITPEYSLKYKGSVLIPGTDYETVYSNNVNAGTATVTFIATGSKTGGVLSKTFKIDKASVKEGMSVEVTGGDSHPYAKSGVTPEVTVKWKGTLLVQGKDYRISYSNNKKISTDTRKAGIVITGIGNFKDSYTRPFEIVKQNIGKDEITGKARGKLVVDDFAFVKKANAYKKTKIYVYDSNGTALTSSDYTITRWEILSGGRGNASDREKGIAQPGDIIQVTVEGMGCYEGSRTAGVVVYDSAEFNALNKAAVSYREGKGAVYSTAKKAFEYQGKAVCPDESNLVLKITTGSGKNKQTVTLNSDEYVILNYENNLNKGTARMIIRGNGGKYKGIKAVTYKITGTKQMGFL